MMAYTLHRLDIVDRETAFTEIYMRNFVEKWILLKTIFALENRWDARTRSPLPKITRPRYSHKEYSQGSTSPVCNGQVSSWRNRLVDHG